MERLSQLFSWAVLSLMLFWALAWTIGRATQWHAEHRRVNNSDKSGLRFGRKAR